MKHNHAALSTMIVSGTVTGALLAGLAGPVFAAQSPAPGQSPAPARSALPANVDKRRAACEAAVQKRLTSITATQDKVQSAKGLTDSDRAALLSQIGDDNNGLKALGTKIAGDDPTQLKADCASIVNDYRWFALELPKAHLVIAADTATGLAQKLNDASTRIQRAIDRAKAAGKDVGQAQADQAALNGDIKAGLASAAGVPGAVLPLKPQDYVSGNEKDALQKAHDALVDARNHFKAARADAKKAIADLKALLPHKGAAPPAATPAASPTP